MSFHQSLWEENQDIIQKIHNMDFIQEMVQGELSDEKFFYYIEQDIHYLHDYVRAASYLTTKSYTVDQLKYFHELAQGAFLEIKSIHETYKSKENYSPKNVFTPAYCNYRNFILSYASTQPLAIAFAGMLACPWLYIDIGKTYRDYNFSNTKYQFWFQANSAEEVLLFFEKSINMIEYFAKQYPHYHEQMRFAFREAMFQEYNFWQDAYDLKSL